MVRVRLRRSVCCGGGNAHAWSFFFFQAEDGIRDYKVTGVQTCALPISLVGFGWWIFDVGVRGSVAALAAITILGSLSFAGLGMLVASRARTIEAVSGLDRKSVV